MQVKIQLVFDNEKTLWLSSGGSVTGEKVDMKQLLALLAENSGINKGDSLSYWDENRRSYVFLCVQGDESVGDLGLNLIADN